MKTRTLACLIAVALASGITFGSDEPKRPPPFFHGYPLFEITDTLGFVTTGTKGSTAARPRLPGNPIGGYFVIKMGKEWQRVEVESPAQFRPLTTPP